MEVYDQYDFQALIHHPATKLPCSGALHLNRTFYLPALAMVPLFERSACSSPQVKIRGLTVSPPASAD